MAAYATEPPPAQPGATSRRRAGAFIAFFVALQLVVPLTYVIREDHSDDRFTWRGLVGASVPECTAEASVRHFDGTQEKLDPRALLHEDWVAYLEQGRQSVVDAFLLDRCRGDIERAELVNRCDDDRGVRAFVLRCGGERAFETTRTALR